MKIERWGWYSIGVNVVLAAINAVISARSQSLAVSAEMVHNLVDLLTAIAVLVGLYLSGPKTKAFPYGLYRLENALAVVLALMTFVTAYEISRDALFAPARTATVRSWMLLGLVLATAIPLAFSWFELRAGREANSPVLIADAREYRTHVFTTGVVFASLVGQSLGIALDRWAALIIVVAVVRTGWDLLIGGMRVLLDASLEPETLETIREIILSEPSVSELQWVTGRNAGRFRFVEAAVTLRLRDLARASAASRRIESGIRERVPHVDRVIIHAEAARLSSLRFAMPLASSDGLLDRHFGEAPQFAIVTVGVADYRIQEQRILANPHLTAEKSKGIRVAEWLAANKADVLLLLEAVQGSGPAYVLRDAGIETRITTATSLQEQVALLAEGATEPGGAAATDHVPSRHAVQPG